MWDEIVENYELLELRWRILLVSKHLMWFWISGFNMSVAWLRVENLGF
jgi:hypothetical protein